MRRQILVIAALAGPVVGLMTLAGCSVPGPLTGPGRAVTDLDSVPPAGPPGARSYRKELEKEHVRPRLEDLERAVVEAPDEAGPRRELALELSRRGRFTEAAEVWREHLRLAPDAASSRVRLAAALHYLGRDDEARQVAAEAARRGEGVPAQLEALLAGRGRRALRASAATGTVATARPPVLVAGGEGFALEPAVWADPGDPFRVVTAWIDSRVPDPQRFGISHLYAAVSADGGLSWNEPQAIPAPALVSTEVEGDPTLVADPKTGSLWLAGVAILSGGGLFTAHLPAGADLFEPPVVVVDGQTDKPHLGFGPNAVPSRPDQLYLTHRLGWQVSRDRGLTWSEPFPLQRMGIGHQLKSFDFGLFVVAYWDREGTYYSELSTDSGISFRPVLNLAQRMDVWEDGTDSSRVPGRFRVPPFLSLAADLGGRIFYGVYADTTAVVDGEADVDIYLVSSADGGRSWGVPVAIPAPGDQIFPWLEVDAAGRLHLLYLDSRHTPQQDADEVGFFDAYYALSEDGGASWGELRLSPESFSSANAWIEGVEFFGDYLGLAVSGGRAYAAYPATWEGGSDLYVQAVDLELAGGTEPCAADAATLCLAGGRFEVRIEWATGGGDAGAGFAVPLTADTGHFWFFDPANVEVIVKVLDACPFADRFWVFAGGLTNVEVRITVRDAATGQVRAYVNSQGTAFAPVQDTGAFSTCG